MLETAVQEACTLEDWEFIALTIVATRAASGRGHHRHPIATVAEPFVPLRGKEQASMEVGDIVPFS